MGLHDLWGGGQLSNSRSSASSQPRNPQLPPRPPRRADEDNHSSVISSQSTKNAILTASDDFDQIERDVARCTWHLLTGSQRAQRLQMEHKRNRRVARLIRRKQRRLANLINWTLVKSYKCDRLRYYQGFHDVACIFLSVLGGGKNASRMLAYGPTEGLAADMGLDLAAEALLRISESHLRDCLKTNFSQLQAALRLTLFPLLAKLDPGVHDHLYAAEMEPYFCLSWVITWFAHEIRDTDLVKRLFDVFMVSHPLMPIYMAVAMVIHPLNRREVLECECDFSLLHQCLTGLPKNSSMVGWKYRPGDGFVSDDEHDDGTVSTDTMDNASMDTEFLLSERVGGDREELNTETNSLISTALSSMEPPARVSFQELIDNALDLMRKIPPRKLLPLAARYYGHDEVELILQSAPSIKMLEPPADWALQSTAKADWFLKQRAKERRLSSPRKRDREPDAAKEAHDPEVVKVYLKENAKSRPVIAAGYGPGDDDERRRRKRRKVLLATAVAVVVVAVAVGVVMQYGGVSKGPVAKVTPPLEAEESQRAVLSSPLEKTPSVPVELDLSVEAAQHNKTLSVAPVAPEPLPTSEAKVNVSVPTETPRKIGETPVRGKPAARASMEHKPKVVIPVGSPQPLLAKPRSSLPPTVVKLSGQVFPATMYPPTWSATASHYGVVTSNVVQASRRAYQTVEPTIVQAAERVVEMVQKARHSEAARQAREYTRDLLVTIQTTAVPRLHALASRSMQLAGQGREIVQPSLDRLAKSIMNAGRQAAAWGPVQKLRAQLIESPGSCQAQRTVVQVTTSPVMHMLLETTVQALMEASIFALYGK